MNTQGMIQEHLPGTVEKELEARGLNGEPVLLATSTDLSLSGEPRRHWIVATSRHVSVVADDQSPLVVCSVGLPEVSTFRIQGTIGSGFLQAWVDESWVDLARYSNTLANRFSRVAGRLEELRTTGHVTVTPDDEIDDARCPECRLKLPGRGEPCPKCLPRQAILLRLMQMLRPQWRSALGMCLLMLVGVLAELAPPKLQQQLVDRILNSGAGSPDVSQLMQSLLVVVLSLAVTRVVLGLVGYLKGILATRVGVALTSDLRGQMVQKLHSLGVGYFDRHQVGSLTSRVTGDSEVIHSLLQQITGGFLLQIFQVVAVGAMLFTLNAKLACYMLIPTPLVIGGSWFFWKRVYPRYYRYWDSSSKQAGSLTGMLSGIRVVKAFSQEQREFDRFQKFSEYLRQSRTTVEESTAAFSSIMQLIFSLGALIVWYVGGRDVLEGQMTLGALMAFLAYVAMFYAPLATLSQLTTWLTSFMTGCQRVFELLDTPVETRESDKPVSWTERRGAIRFDNVTFGYERHRPVLKNVSLEIPAGQMVGVVGRSGSGKTTLVNLMCRFYDVTGGSVCIDGVNVRDLPREDLRRQVGIVLQEPFLFRGTIWDNLVYGEPDATREQAITAARAAQAHDFILRAPLGYDTWLGERGAGLSGGERQRLSIARALLYNPGILILDEATSSVDTESEQAIQQALKVLTRGRTTIAIAHRLTTLKDAHRILVFDQGLLIEQGSHTELMAQNGHYARLVRIQTQLSSASSVDAVVSQTNDTLSKATAVSGGNPSGKGGSEIPPECSDGAVAGHEPRWLEPTEVTCSLDQFGCLDVIISARGSRLPEGETKETCHHRGVFAVRLFPASEPDGYISLRTWDRDGREHEAGLIRDLRQWPADAQAMIRSALARRYLLRVVTGVDSVRVDFGNLTMQLRTEHGPQQMVMRWSQSQVQDFGPRGKVLIDLEDNRFLVRDVDELNHRERELFQRYIYW